MRRYKLYLDGVGYIDNNGNKRYYSYINHRNSKRAVMEYGRNATITDMHDREISKAIIDADGRIHNVNIERRW